MRLAPYSFASWCLLCGLANPVLAAQNESLAATPYRPTVSNPAELSVPRHLEVEFGWSNSQAVQLSKQSMQYLGKYAFNEHWGVLFGGETLVRERNAEELYRGRGDTFLAVKHLLDLDTQGLGFEVGMNFTAAQSGKSTHSPDLFINGIHSIDFSEHWRLDTNLGLSQLRHAEEQTGHYVWLWVTCLGYSTGNWGLAFEVAGNHQKHVANSTQVLTSVSYAINPRLVIDAAFTRMHQKQEFENTILFGLTWLLDKKL
ncbi:MAG: hypothetical protein C0495_02780 [Acinetobacter sp.]|nr:hypothetical protein [Acinetobacter sp.]